jgi:hypothetical protein
LVKRQMTDLPGVAQIGEVLQRIEIAGVAIIPPMELQQVEAVDPHPPPRHRDRFLDNAPRHRAGRWHPFGKGLDVSERRLAASGGNLLPECSDQVLGRAVMVGEVPGGEPGIVIGKHRLDRAHRVDPAMPARHLP